MRRLRQVGRGWPVVGTAYVLLLVGAYVWWVAQPPGERLAAVAGSSTDLDHLEHVPWLVLPASSLWSGHLVGYWAAVALLCLGGLERLRGPLLTLGTGAVAHVVGTLVSEGVVAIRIAAGTLSSSARHVLDVGPSYVVASCAAAVVVSSGARTWVRVACGLTLVPLVVTAFDLSAAGQVAAVGHAVAVLVGVAAARLRAPARAVAPARPGRLTPAVRCPSVVACRTTGPSGRSRASDTPSSAGRTGRCTPRS